MKKPKISIIVTAKNNGEYLEECLLSCLNQTLKPFEVIYSDDFSDDDSVKIASKIKGVTLVENKEWIGVVKARNNGVAKSSGDFLVHVDGDDKLPKDFLALHYEAMEENTPFTYCAAQCFGAMEVFYKVPEWNEKSIWVRNFVNTSAMYRRKVFEACGGWQETSLKTMWDWSLAIRASRFGTPKTSKAVLLYRQHEKSWSKKKKKEIPDYAIQHHEIRKELVELSICCVYGGRLPDMMPIWLNHLITDIEILKNKPELIIINNSEKPIHWITSYHKRYFKRIKIIKGYGSIDCPKGRERQEKVSTLLADCHNLAMKHMTGDIIHYREDDMLTNPGAFEKLFNFIIHLDHHEKQAAASSLYLNRHHPRIVGGKYNYKEPRLTGELKEIPKDMKPIPVDFTGTGCLIYWRDLCPQVWYPFAGGNICAHDWRFGLDLKEMGKDIYIIPDSICKHVRGLEWDWTEPEITDDISVLNHTRKKT